MTIIRIVHNKENPYVVLHKSALENPRLSFKAKGLWAYCLSRPDNWEFHVSHLKTVSKEGEDAVYSALKELIEEGYCERVQHIRPKDPVTGKWGFHKLDYVMYETPIKKINTQPENPGTHFPEPENPALISNDPNQVKKNKEREGVPPPPPTLSSEIKIKREEHVSTTEQEHIRLSEEFGGPTTAAAYKKLSEWKLDTPRAKWKKDDNRSIRRWVLDALKEKKPSMDTNGNQNFYDRMKNLFRSHQDITFGSTYVEFNFGPMNKPHIKVADNSFIEQCENCLRKMGLKL